MNTRLPILALALAATALPASAQTFEHGERNTQFEPAFPEQFRARLETTVTPQIDTVASGLVHPWGIAVLPGEDGYLVTERPGRLRHLGKDGTLSDPITGLPEVAAQDQGGLLDIALAPDFADSRMIYWTYAKPVEGGFATAAARGTLSDDLSEVTGAVDIFVQEPAVPEAMHFGSRIVFDGEGHVFITTGEHFTEENRQMAQDLDATFGKVVRLNLDGTVPEDNPYTDDDAALDSIWSYGHRNIQGAEMIDGQLWINEHGPKGGDELNLVEPGVNYGWPVVSYGVNYDGSTVGQGNAQAEGMEQPVYFWDPVIAPAGMTVYDGDMFTDWQGDLLISSLVPGGIVRIALEDNRVTAEERIALDLGRVRDVVVDQDGSVLALTDFEDGRVVRLTME